MKTFSWCHLSWLCLISSPNLIYLIRSSIWILSYFQLWVNLDHLCTTHFKTCMNSIYLMRYPNNFPQSYYVWLIKPDPDRKPKFLAGISLIFLYSPGTINTLIPDSIFLVTLTQNPPWPHSWIVVALLSICYKP